ncbi:MAG: hypothetical protein M3P06_07595 [Acidobacteriota bacterium]|nr:hypothetical protein [Acidobacteriota bacterium]
MHIDYGRYRVELGPLSEGIYSGVSWTGDGYPAWQMFADELERLLCFARDEGVLEMYRTELRGRANQRDSAIEELRVAYLLNQKGFRVQQWRPVGLSPREGEFQVCGADNQPIFVEVKSPGWESELSQEERLTGRLAEPKYRATEASFADGGSSVIFAIDKAYPKFDPQQRNLLVVADDLFFPLEFQSSLAARNALYWDDGKFTDRRYENLAGVGFLEKKQSSDTVWSEMKLFLNPYAGTPLPESIIAAFGGVMLE